MRKDEYGNQIFENALERFITSRNLNPPFWIPYEQFTNQTEFSLFADPLRVWISKRYIVRTTLQKIYLTSAYIYHLCDLFDKRSDPNARVILNHLNQEYESNKNINHNTTLP